MKFGPVPVDSAVGAILAHSVMLPDGKRIRKGVVLENGHIQLLKDAGVQRPTVGRLMPEDVSEDQAAQRLADALIPDPIAQHVRIGPADHGSTFLYATVTGVLVVDPTRVRRTNLVDPEITVATLEPYTRVSPGMMIGSIKTISYAVPEKKIARAEAAAMRAIHVEPVKIATASFIETVLPMSTKESPKGLRAVSHRLKMLGINLIETSRVPHETVALQNAIEAATGDMILILTASATSDRRDTAPSALVRAGGKITRFGMPVDPGHLLFYGALRGRPVIGLPGCARSLVPNGADFVIERIACGLTISPSAFAAMGIGGLLKDTSARGLPRSARA